MSNRKTMIGSRAFSLHKMPLYFMLAPFLIIFFLFVILPIFSSILLSFFSYDMVGQFQFTGLDNYFRLFMDDDVFPIALKNTLLFSVVTGPLGFMLSFILAWFINDFSPKVRTLLSLLFYAPALVGNAYYIWKIIFSGDSYGYMNSFLLSSGVITQPIVWLKSPEHIMLIVIIVQLWQGMGVSFLANISGLQNVNGEMYEAGAIDGIRNRWQELWYITLPSMKNILLFSAVMQIQASFSVGIIAVELAGFPSVNHAVDTIVAHMMDVGTVRYEMGYASAISVFLFAMMAVTRIVIGKILDSTGK